MISSETLNNRERINSVQNRESGTATALEAEIEAGEWDRLNEFEVYRKRTREGRIMAMTRAIGKRIEFYRSTFFTLARNFNDDKAKTVHRKQKKLERYQGLLAQFVAWEPYASEKLPKFPAELDTALNGQPTPVKK